MKEHFEKAVAGCLKNAKANQALASCERAMMGKGSADDYRNDKAMAHDAASEGWCEIAEAIIAASKTPDVDASGIDRHATEMGGMDFSAAIKTLFADSDLSKITSIPRTVSAPIDKPTDSGDLNLREIFET